MSDWYVIQFDLLDNNESVIEMYIIHNTICSNKINFKFLSMF